MLELVGGVLLLRGRLVAPTAAVLGVVMVVAIAVSGIAQGDVVPSLTLAPLLLAGLLLLLADAARLRSRAGAS